MLAVPPVKLSLCEALVQLTAATWLEIGAGEVCWQPLNEEAITDYNLMRLAYAVPSAIVEKHSKRRENRTGADWEWWVGRPGAYVGFRIQAKRLDTHAKTYPHLFSTKAEATYQIDKLISRAESDVPRRYPIIAFYNYWFSTDRPSADSPCGSFDAVDELHGWTLASAYLIREVLRRTPTKRLAAFRSLQFPVPCLFCCPATCHRFGLDGSETSLAHIVAHRISNRWSDVSADVREPSIHEIAPVYVERMFKGERPDDGWAEIGLPTPPARFIPRDLARVLLLRELPEEPQRAPAG